MHKTLFLGFLSFLTFFSSLNADDITGFWKTYNDKTKKAESIIAVYTYQGKQYGKIIGSFNSEGVIDDSIYDPQGRATGVAGNPYYSGLDIIWNLQSNGSRYKGKIMDPRNGNTYNVELWTRNGDLVVRGKLFIFGSNRIWKAAKESDFTSAFPKPDLNKLTPRLPQ
jgi:uncharacterized protein (DUF2147 family)